MIINKIYEASKKFPTKNLDRATTNLVSQGLVSVSSHLVAQGKCHKILGHTV